MGEGGGCFPAGVMVSTPTGKRAIETLKVGDEVLSYGYSGEIAVSEVQKVHRHPDEQVLRIGYWGGSLRVTANHWVLNQYNTFAHAGLMQDDDALVDGVGHLRPVTGMSIDGREDVFNLTVFPNHTFIADNIRVHNGGRGLTEPVVGAGGGGGKGGGGSRVAVEDPDSLLSHQYVKVIDLLSEGEIGGLVNGLHSVFINDTPIISPSGTTNFTGVEVDHRVGTNYQTPLPGFGDVESESSVSVEVKHDTPIVRSIAGEVDAARITLGFPMLTSQNKSTGDLHGTSVSVSIDINNAGGGYRPAPLRYVWSGVSGSGTQIDVANCNGIGITANMQCGISKVLVRKNVYGHIRTRYEDKMVPLSWKIEYKPPGGAWTLLKTETAAPGGTADGVVTYAFANANGLIKIGSGTQTTTVVPSWIMRSYESPQGSFGTWSIRVVLLSEGSVSSISGKYLTTVGDDIISGKTTSRYRRSYYIPLPAPGPWDIRVTRNTADSTDSAVRNETWWDSMTEVVESKLSYPNSAYVGLKIGAEQFSDIPTRGYEIYGIKCKVPSNYDPIAKTYSGTWNGTFKTAWTDNPAWVYYDLATVERYGLGRYIDASKIDKWALYEIAKYCDEDVPSGYGYLEPRFTCNAYIQTREDAYKLMSNLASVFRGMSYWTGQVVAIADMPSEPVAIFTNANVINGEFSYAGSSRNQRHTVALVTWNDPTDMYKQKVEYVEDFEGVAKYGINQTEVVAFACTSRGQARRMGKWILYTERLESEVVSWKTGLEGFSVYPGAIVKIADKLRSGDRIGGRILSATTASVTLDSSVKILPNLSYTLSVVAPDGGVVNRAVMNGVEETNTITVYPAFDVAPQDYSMWAIASENLNPQTMRIISVVESEKTQVEVSALQHDPNKFDMIEYDEDFEPLNTSSIKNDGPESPTNLVATDTLYLQGPGVVGTKCHVSWSGTSPRYEIKWKQFDNNFVTLTETTNSTDIMPVETGEIVVQVRSVDMLGRKSPISQLKYNVLGKSVPPAQPTGFSGYVTDAGIVLTWIANADLDLKEYEILVNGQSVQKTAALTWTYPLTPSGLTNFAIRAIDTTVNISTLATTSVTITAPVAPSVAYSFSAENVVLAITKPASQLSIDYYEIFYTNASAQLVSLGKTSATTFPVRGAWVGDRLFSVKAVDIGGNVSNPGSVSVTIIAPPKPELTAQVVDNNVLLFWTSATGSLPIDTFEARRGSTWETATVIGTKSGGFTTIFETAAGRFDYWVAAIDTAGNYSIAANRSVTVSQPPDYILKVSTDSIFAVNTPAGVTASTLTNGKIDVDGYPLLPINTTETFEQHFSSRSWATPQAQVSAGYPMFAQPGYLTGSYEEVIDLGTILAAMKITLNYSGVVVSGSPTITTTISTKRLIGDAWTDNVGVDQFYGSAFQYVKVKISVMGDDKTLYKLTGVNTKLDAKLKSDAGTVACVSTDTKGTVVNFNAPFVDVTSVTLSPSGTTATTAVYDYYDSDDDVTYAVSGNVATITHTAHPYVTGQAISFTTMTGGGVNGTYIVTGTTANTYTVAMTTANTSGAASIYPESMRVYLFNSTTGARVSGNVSWNLKGY